MEINTKPLRRCDIVTVKGRIDSATAKVLAENLEAITTSGRYNIVLNLKEVSFLSSAGLGELIGTQKKCKQPLNRGELVLAETPKRIKDVLDLAGITPLFKLFEHELEAVGSF